MQNEHFKDTMDSSSPHNLWDEIFKAIVSSMPSQLFPLFREVFGREYPPDTPIVLLSSETSSFPENPKAPPSSSLMDVALLVSGTDYYHLECQMQNDHEMVIRMFVYDIRFSLTHTRTVNDSGDILLRFPHSAIIYPEKNEAIPETLKCRILFPDGSEHLYQVPTVRIQSYSLEEIKRKHLTLFVPYLLLRLRPRLMQKSAKKLTEYELTNFMKEVILLLQEELTSGYLSRQEYNRYLYLFQLTADRILEHEPHLHKEAAKMTECLIKFPDQIVEELKAENQTYKAENQAYKAENQTYKAENLAYKTENQKLRALLAQHGIDSSEVENY